MGTGEPKDDTWISSEPPTSLVERNGLLRKKKKKKRKMLIFENAAEIWGIITVLLLYVELQSVHVRV